MDSLANWLIALASLGSLIWIVRNIAVVPLWRRIFRLTPQWQGPPLTDAPRVSVVVAAKDEEATIADCVRSIFAQDYGDIEMIIVNDRSADRTGAIADTLAARERRLKVIHIDALPAGWGGKNHAMQKGIAASSGQWILMTDADCRLRCRQALTLAMAHARQDGSDLLTLMPDLEMLTFWERLIQPICAALLMFHFPPHRANNPRSDVVAAHGAFMLIRRSAYDAIGTHEAFKASLIDDMDMARRIKGLGLRLTVTPSQGLVGVRMYSTLEQILRGWNRIFFGVFSGVGHLGVALAGLVGVGLTCYVLAAAGLGVCAIRPDAGQAWRTLAMIAAAGSLAEAVMVCRFYRLGGWPWYYGLLYPLSCIIVAGMLVRTMLMHRPGARLVWRDTAYAPAAAPHAGKQRPSPRGGTWRHRDGRRAAPVDRAVQRTSAPLKKV
ncbi:MAG: glycosyltransferase family 2 protein [Planctomycetaceae bacterium]|nr:glycosyltransferase family 2 protein [Planctomycetaceae bacterium]